MEVLNHVAINWAAIDWVTLVTLSLFVLIAYNVVSGFPLEAACSAAS